MDRKFFSSQPSQLKEKKLFHPNHQDYFCHPSVNPCKVSSGKTSSKVYLWSKRSKTVTDKKFAADYVVHFLTGFRMRQDTDQKNSVFGHFSRSVLI